MSVCGRCKKYAIWVDGKMISPDATGIAPPNPDLNPDIQADYLEAASIVQKSSRGASALLRLALQKLCIQLGQPGKSINDDIAALVKSGLNPTVQKSLDILRVVGNNAVHPGELDLRDNPDTANKLFVLINFIADAMITQPKEIEATFSALPEGSRKAVADRDKPKS